MEIREEKNIINGINIILTQIPKFASKMSFLKGFWYCFLSYIINSIVKITPPSLVL